MRLVTLLSALLATFALGCGSSDSGSSGAGEATSDWSAVPSDQTNGDSPTPPETEPGQGGPQGRGGDGVRSDDTNGGREAGTEIESQIETEWGPFGDPFAEQSTPPSGLTDTSTSLTELLENGEMEGACDRYASDPTNEVDRLLCGKWMFFYQGFGTRGVPKPLVDFLLEHFQDELGYGFSKLGLVPDPSSEAGYPLGMALNDEETELSFTCASCRSILMNLASF